MRIANAFALPISSNRFDYWGRGRPWVERGGDDGDRGDWTPGLFSA
jgi:hypothetical protein